MGDFTFKTVAFPDAIMGLPYEAGIAIASPATAVTAGVVATGALPTGLVVNATDHVRITGTPALSNTPGLFTFTLTLTDTAGGVTSGTYTILLHASGTTYDDVDAVSPTDGLTVAQEVAQEFGNLGTT
jgi:hypothetical protein